MRVIDEKGENLGILNLSQALKAAYERNLDLVQITEKLVPPVCKIIDYGKYLYRLKKKSKGGQTTKAGEIKGIRLTFAISPHDLQTRVRQSAKFLEKGHKIKVEIILRGRQRGLRNFARAKMEEFVAQLRETTPVSLEQPLRERGNRLTIILAKQ